MCGHIEFLHKLWERAKYVLKPEELNTLAKELPTQEELNKMFLNKDEKEWTAQHIAVIWGHIEFLHKQ